MVEKEKKVATAPSWYKGWFIILESGAPITEKPGAYHIDFVKDGAEGLDEIPDSADLDREAQAIGDVMASPGYLDALEKDRIKFPYQKQLFSKASSKSKEPEYTKLNPRVVTAEQLASLSKVLREIYSAEEKPNLSIDFSPINEEEGSYLLVGISLDGFYPLRGTYERHLDEINLPNVFRMQIK